MFTATPTPAFRRVTSDTADPVMNVPPGIAETPQERHWLALALLFARGASQRRSGASGALPAPWVRPCVLRHAGCGGLVGHVLDLDDRLVLGTLGPDGTHDQFEALQISGSADRADLLAGTTTIESARCSTCRATVSLRPARPVLRRLRRGRIPKSIKV